MPTRAATIATSTTAIRRIPGGILTTEDKHDLVAFIEACSGPLPVVETGRLPLDPRHADDRGRPLNGRQAAAQ